MDSVQASIDAESSTKKEALWAKKKLENDINELEITLDHSNKANVEAQKAIKRSQDEIKDIETSYNEEHRQVQALAEKSNLADRKANVLKNELEEAQTLLESTEQAKKNVNRELEDARADVNRMQAINAKETAAKRQLESQIHAIRAEMDDAIVQVKANDEKTKKTMVDATRLVDEVRTEQDHTNIQEKSKTSLEYQLREVNMQLADREEAASKEGRMLLSKLEIRIHELEVELANCQVKTSDTTKAHQRVERSIKELEFQKEEDLRNHERMSELVTKLQQKIKTYKKQIEEAEEIAALNLSKYRKAQQEYEETEERTKLAEMKLYTFNPII